MSNKLRKCKICLIEKSIDEFYKKKYNCKPCNSIVLQKQYKENKIEERKLYRDKLKMLCMNDGVTDEEFNRQFIPYEKFEIMKKLPELFSFHQLMRLES